MHPEWTEKNRIGESQRTSRTAERECQRKDGPRCEAAISAEQPHGEAEVLEQIANPSLTPRFPYLLRYQSGASERAPRGVGGILRREAILALLPGLQIQMVAKLTLQVRLAFAAAHDSSPGADHIIRPIASTSRLQFDSSTESCFFPAGVSR